MKTKANYIDYGIYIDGQKSFIVSLNSMADEALIDEFIEENRQAVPFGKKISAQEHLQNKGEEVLKKFCKSIVEKLVHPRNILVFGPSTTKHNLQNEIRDTKRLQTITEQVITTGIMNKNAAKRFVIDYYTHELEVIDGKIQGKLRPGS